MVTTVLLEISVYTTVLFSACAVGMRRKLRQIAIMLLGSEPTSPWLRSGPEEGGNSRRPQCLPLAHARCTRVPCERRGSSRRLLLLLAIPFIFPACPLALQGCAGLAVAESTASVDRPPPTNLPMTIRTL